MSEKTIILSKQNDLAAASLAMNEGRLDDASSIYKSLFEKYPDDIDVLRGLAELGRRRGHFKDAAEILRRAILLRPDLKAAKFDLLPILSQMHQHEEALLIADELLNSNQDNLQLIFAKANLLLRTGDNLGAIELLEKILTREFDHAGIWMLYGHALKSVGRLSDSINAYREALLLDSALGDAWWSLANIKTFKFSKHDLELMESAIDRDGRPVIDRSCLHFALAKALEDNNRDSHKIFKHYEKGNSLRRSTVVYDKESHSKSIQKAIEFQSKEFFDVRFGNSCETQEPIFILGMPRSGSTLVEQILASHPMIEATNELHEIISIASRLSKGNVDSNTQEYGYLNRLSRLNGGQLKALGQEYLDRTRIQRKSNRPYFIDKMPANWRHVGLIHLILPKAKIIDTRRNPMDCCWSNYKQHYGMGHANSYDLEEMGSFYVDYVRYMAHIDEVLPGRVYRVIHENLVNDTESEVKSLLDYIGIEFDKRCLKFWEGERIVKTPSAEQVRKPINKDGMNQWLKYEPWLNPLKDVLGDVLKNYPEVPNFSVYK